LVVGNGDARLEEGKVIARQRGRVVAQAKRGEGERLIRAAQGGVGRINGEGAVERLFAAFRVELDDDAKQVLGWGGQLLVVAKGAVTSQQRFFPLQQHFIGYRVRPGVIGLGGAAVPILHNRIHLGRGHAGL